MILRERTFLVRTCESARRGVQNDQTEHEHCFFDPGGPNVERIELGTEWTVSGKRRDLSRNGSNCVHAGNDSELRDCRQCQHENHEEMTEPKRSPVSGRHAAVCERGGDEYYS